MRTPTPAQKIILLTLTLMVFAAGVGVLLFKHKYERELHLRQHLLEQRETYLRDTLTQQSMHMYLQLLQLKLRLLESGQLKAGATPERRAVESIFADYLSQDSMISQVRWLDANGREQMRLDRHWQDNKWLVRSALSLQDKSRRYYFRETIGLAGDQVYASPLDLNVEAGNIVRPLQPTIRMGIPTTGADGMLAGVLIINYDLGPLFKNLYHNIEQGVLLQLVDAEGYWLFNNKNPDWAWRQLNPGFHLASVEPGHLTQLQLALSQRDVIPTRKGKDMLQFARLDLFPPAVAARPLVIISSLTPEIRNQLALTTLRRELPSLVAVVLLAGLLLLFIIYAERNEIRLVRRLRKKVAVAEQSSKQMSVFLANMSHEIRTPMTAIMGMLDLLRQSDLSPEQGKRIARIRKSARLLLQIISDILDLNKIEAGKMSLEQHNSSVVEVLEDCLAMVSATAQQKGLELHLQLGHELHEYVFADGLRLSQVISNLLENAIKFTERGHVILTLTQVTESSFNTTLRFAVRDTGIGMSGQEIERFSGAHRSARAQVSREKSGIGLGLIISNLLLQLMGSRLQVESIPGSGSTFSFDVTFEKRQSPQALTLLTLAPLTDACILVVDEQPLVLKTLGDIFWHWNIEARLVDNYAEGLELLMAAEDKSKPYRVLLLDHRILQQYGIELLDDLQQMVVRSATQPLQVVVMAPDTEVDDYQSSDAKRRGLLTLNKPVTPSGLAQLLCQPEELDSLAGFSRESAATLNQPFRLVPSSGAANRQFQVLVVEDNQTNQIVIVELLQRFGLSVITADNGALALQLVHSQKFDLVFMDIQMSVLDGLAATRKIRKFRSAEELPIVALSAAAMTSDLKAAQAAGMNGHMAKPIDVVRLREVLLKFLPAAVKVRDSGVPPQADALELFRHDRDFDLRSSVAETVGEQVYLKALAAFCGDMAPLLASWQQLRGQWNLQQKRDLLHMLKGSAGGIGAVELLREMVLADSALQAGRDYDLQVLMARLTRVHDKIGAALAETEYSS